MRRSFSDAPAPAARATDPEGDDVRGGVEMDAESETGVEGCSGAEAVAFGSRRPESSELAGEGDLVGGRGAETEAGTGTDAKCYVGICFVRETWTCSTSLAG